MKDKKIFKNLQKLGEEYCKNLKNEYCKDQKMKEELEDNWWIGLEFFFGRSFNRGRRDELSHKYKTFTLKVLKNRFEIENGNMKKSYRKLLDDAKRGYLDKDIFLDFKIKYGLSPKMNSIAHKNFNSDVHNKNPLIKKLTTKQKIIVDYSFFDKGEKEEFVYLGNEKDVMMVLDVLAFISIGGRMNIYKYLKDTIENKGLEYTYDLLVDNEEGIAFIGDKLATFIIRDIYFLNTGMVKGKNVDYKFMFPVDTWVKQIYRKMAEDNGKVSENEIKQWYIDKCIKYGYSPPKVAAGVWYMGFKSLDLVVDHLHEIKL